MMSISNEVIKELGLHKNGMYLKECTLYKQMNCRHDHNGAVTRDNFYRQFVNNSCRHAIEVDFSAVYKKL